MEFRRSSFGRVRLRIFLFLFFFAFFSFYIRQEFYVVDDETIEWSKGNLIVHRLRIQSRVCDAVSNVVFQSARIHDRRLASWRRLWTGASYLDIHCRRRSHSRPWRPIIWRWRRRFYVVWAEAPREIPCCTERATRQKFRRTESPRSSQTQGSPMLNSSFFDWGERNEGAEDIAAGVSGESSALRNEEPFGLVARFTPCTIRARWVS